MSPLMQPHLSSRDMTDEELRDLAAAQQAAIRMLVMLKRCSYADAVEILRQAEVAAAADAVVAFGPDKSDTIH